MLRIMTNGGGGWKGEQTSTRNTNCENSESVAEFLSYANGEFATKGEINVLMQFMF